jgi:hypothetical protein
MFFHNFGGMHATLEYYQLTSDKTLRNGLIKMAESIVAVGDPRALRYSGKVIGFGIQQSPDNEELRAFATNWLSSAEEGSNMLANIVSADPTHWSGTTAYLNWNIPGSLFSINSMPYLLSALGSEPELQPEASERIKQQNQQGVLRTIRPLSWQSEFDEPGFDDYLAPWQPWRSE